MQHKCHKMWRLKCVWVWVLLFQLATNCECFVNLVHGQGLTATVTMSASPYDGQGPSNAVDGDTGGTCAAMNLTGGYDDLWLKVWLSTNFSVAELKIYFQEATIYRSTGFSIYVYDTESYIPPSNVSGELVYQHDPTTGCPPENMTIPVNKVTRGIAFYNTEQRALQSSCNDTGQDELVEICEFHVFGCDPIRYSHQCSQVCSVHCLNRHCDAHNGKCTAGCQNPNRGGAYCEGCDDRHYSADCSLECGYCEHMERCHNVTGQCKHGCEPTWQEPYCKECDNGHYLSDCTGVCGHCKNGERCHNETGMCTDGCQPNWRPPVCLECDDNHYSSDCSGVCGHCKNGSRCHNITGHCKNGCQPNWQEPLCQECADGLYGVNCSEPCGHCGQGTVCDKLTGDCPQGCQLNWDGCRCDDCGLHKYGANCSLNCGHCKDDQPCSTGNGTCLNGCEEGWEGDTCSKALPKLEGQGADKTDTSHATGLYAGIGVLTTLIFLGSFLNVVLIYNLRTQAKRGSTRR